MIPFQTHGSPNASALLKLMFLSFWAYLSICMLCNSGDTVVKRFEEIDIYYLCEWHTFPNSVKRIMPSVIINSQIPVGIEAFGNVSCSRETTKRVNMKFKLSPDSDSKHFPYFVLVNAERSLILHDIP